jgi:hypothetical protein
MMPPRRVALLAALANDVAACDLAVAQSLREAGNRIDRAWLASEQLLAGFIKKVQPEITPV